MTIDAESVFSLLAQTAIVVVALMQTYSRLVTRIREVATDVQWIRKEIERLETSQESTSKRIGKNSERIAVLEQRIHAVEKRKPTSGPTPASSA